MRDDQDLMAHVLDDEGVNFVDLRSIWDGSPPHYVQSEAAAADEPGGLAVHPDESGHEIIAAALLETVPADRW